MPFEATPSLSAPIVGFVDAGETKTIYFRVVSFNLSGDSSPPSIVPVVVDRSDEVQAPSGLRRVEVSVPIQ